jgi:hypothetical protein
MTSIWPVEEDDSPLKREQQGQLPVLVVERAD